MAFSDRIIGGIEKKGHPLIVGLDAHPEIVADCVGMREGREEAARATRDFSLKILESLYDLVWGVKIQVAFFERLGPAGWEGLEEVIRAARALGLIVIVDGKRGDIPSTLQAYSQYFLEELQADSMTINPYFGADSIEIFDPYVRAGKGVWVVIQSSGEGSEAIQDVLVSQEGKPYCEYLAERVLSSSGGGGRHGYQSVGLVVGVRSGGGSMERLRARFADRFFLMPGVGAQGGMLEETRKGFNRDGLGGVITLSRSILNAYKDQEWRGGRHAWTEAARWRTRRWIDRIGKVVGTGYNKDRG